MTATGTFSEALESARKAGDELLKQQLIRWSYSMKNRRVSRSEENDSANNAWDSARTEKAAAESEINKIVLKRKVLKRDGESGLPLKRQNTLLIRAMGRKKAAEEKISKMPASRLENAKQARSRKLDSEIDKPFSLIRSSLLDALPARQSDEVVAAKRHSTGDFQLDIIDLNIFLDRSVREDLTKALSSGFSIKPWAQRLFIFGVDPDPDRKGAEPFVATQYHEVYLCNPKFRVTPLFFLALLRGFSGVESCSFFGGDSTLDHLYHRPLATMSALSLHVNEVQKKRHSDEIIENAGDLIESRQNPGRIRIRDLEGRIEAPDGTRVYEKLQTPGRLGALFCAGRYFSKSGNFPRHLAHPLSRALLAWKNGYPALVEESICDFLTANQEHGTVLTVVPDKPGKNTRMRDLLARCQEKLPDGAKFEWEPDLFAFKEQFSTHSVGGYFARYDLVSSNLIAGNGGKKDLRGKKVLIVDDIYTTGATFDALAGSIYKYMGASEVNFFCLARTVA